MNPLKQPTNIGNVEIKKLPTYRPRQGTGSISTPIRTFEYKPEPQPINRVSSAMIKKRLDK